MNRLMHKENIEYTICEINFSNAVEESTQEIRLSSIGKCKIKVYGNEGKIPHFHITDDNGFDCPVCINDARYFNHGSKQDKLNNTQAKELYDVMKSKSKLTSFEGKSVWKVTQMAWILANNDSNIIKRKRPPKYSDINIYGSVHE